MFDNPNTANELIKMISFVCNSSAIFLNLYHKPLVGKIFRFLPFFPYWSFMFNTNFDDIDDLKVDLLEKDSEIYSFNNMCLVSLIIQTATYPFIFYYLKHVIRNEKDSKRNWLFFLKKNRKPNKTIDNSSSSMDLKNLVKKRANRLNKCKVLLTDRF
jgi:hypothetical protein